MKQTVLAFSVLFAAGAAQAQTQPCDWKELARSEDRGRVAMKFDDAYRRIGSLRGEGLDQASKDAALELLRRAEAPAAPGSITGRWKIRSLQFTDHPGTYDFGYAYPFFQARIDKADSQRGCGLTFAKTSGSQRRSGNLYPMGHDPQTLAFLGAKTVNDEGPGQYDPRTANPANTAGRLVRLDEDELLMMLDYDGRGFELYHFKR